MNSIATAAIAPSAKITNTTPLAGGLLCKVRDVPRTGAEKLRVAQQVGQAIRAPRSEMLSAPLHVGHRSASMVNSILRYLSPSAHASHQCRSPGGPKHGEAQGAAAQKAAATFGTECGATLKVGSGVSHCEAADAYVGIHGGSNPAAPAMSEPLARNFTEAASKKVSAR